MLELSYHLSHHVTQPHHQPPALAVAGKAGSKGAQHLSECIMCPRKIPEVGGAAVVFATAGNHNITVWRALE